MLTRTKEIRIETSTVCNFNCIMCPRSSLERENQVMSNDDFFAIVDHVNRELPYITTLTLAGFGEFSTDPGWKEKLSFAKDHFSAIHVLTNLSLFTSSDIQFLLDHVTTVRISLYGFTERTFNKIHHPPSDSVFSTVIDNISTLNRLKTKEHRILINFLELEENVAERREWQEFWKDKADGIEIWRPHNWVNGRAYRVLCEHRAETCGRPFMGPIQVQADSSLNVCCFDYNGELEIGNLKQNTFHEIFSDEPFEEIQRLHQEGLADSIALCSVCDQRNCVACKTDAMVFSSDFDKNERILKTSTSFEALDNY